jgi:hypothetical protein
MANPDHAFGGHLEPGTNVFTFAIGEALPSMLAGPYALRGLPVANQTLRILGHLGSRRRHEVSEHARSDLAIPIRAAGSQNLIHVLLHDCGTSRRTVRTEPVVIVATRFTVVHTTQL